MTILDSEVITAVNKICDRLAGARYCQFNGRARDARTLIDEAEFIAKDLQRELAVRESALIIHPEGV